MPVEFYRRTLLWLAGRGMTRTGTETAWEFARRIGTAHPGIDRNLRFLTETYLAVRFGKHKLSHRQKENVNQASEAIQSALGEKKKKAPERGRDNSLIFQAQASKFQISDSLFLFGACSGHFLRFGVKLIENGDESEYLKRFR